MIIDGHAHAARDCAAASSILRLAQQHRIEKVVLCTSPKNIRDLKDPPNAPSGSHRVRGRDIVQAIGLCSAEHVVFGSDMPYARIGDQIDKLQRLNLSDAVLEQIFGENIRALLSLRSQPGPPEDPSAELEAVAD